MLDRVDQVLFEVPAFETCAFLHVRYMRKESDAVLC